jgi:uncharacterized repeat protein (TIGR01451 family)
MSLQWRPGWGHRGVVPGVALVAFVTFGMGPAAWTALAAEPANAPSERGVIPVVLDTGDANPVDECQRLTGHQNVRAMQIAGEAGGFPAGSPYTDGTLQVTISGWDATVKTFHWAATIPVLGVWVKGGSGGEGNWYDYAAFSDQPPGPGADHDGGLHTKPNPDGPAGLSHVTFCYGPASAGAPDLTVAKTSDAVGALSPGDTITYAIRVSDVGDADAHGVVVTDALPPGVSLSHAPAACAVGGRTLTCSMGTVAAGDETVINVTVAVDATTCGELTNTASVSASDEPAGTADAGNHDDVTDIVECAPSSGPDLVLDKTSDASGSLPRGHAIVYALTVTNVGDTTATGIHIHDDVPPGLQIMGALPTMQGGACSAIATVDSDGNQVYAIDCVRSALVAGASATAAIHMKVDADARCGPLVNAASVAGGNEPRDRRDAHNRDSVTDRVACSPSIAVEKHGPSVAHVGDEVTYTFRASNDGERALVGVRLLDAGCDGTLRRTDGGNGDDTLGRGETWTYVCGHVIAAADGDPVRNTVTVTAADRDGHAVRDTARHSIDVLHPGIAIVTTPSASSAEAGSTVTFSYVVTNTGDTPLFGVRVDDDVLGGVGEITSIQPGASRTLTAFAPLPAAAVPVTNVGTASGHDALGGSVSDRDDAMVTVLAAIAGHHGGSAFTGARTGMPAAFAAVLLALGIAAIAVARRGRGVAQRRNPAPPRP